MLRVSGRTDVGRVRQSNEDAYLLANLSTGERSSDPSMATWSVGDRGVIIAVSDGMGGAKAGEVASALSIEGLYEGLSAPEPEGSAGAEGKRDDAALLRGVIEQVSRKVRDAGQTADRRGMGATLTAVLFRGPLAYVAEVGDSRAYLLRGGSICQVTRDQSYVQLLVDAGLLTPEQAEESPQKNIILQVMGQKEDLRVEVGRIEIRQGDRFLLCSDGLSNCVKDEDILRIAAAPSPVDAACAALVDAANEGGGSDNITVILAEVWGDLPAPSDGACENSVETLQEFRRIP
ncbi:MAG TPA: protein phosphatase 2C domain-containing protein, partial [Polyangiaceae bacterium]|nr:protein phosphatase 2C domain-containing protein [Polyangiaceae bacterium]